MRFSIWAVPALVISSQVMFPATDPVLLSIAPATSKVLAGLDVGRAMNSGVGNYMLQQTINDPSVAKLSNEIGLNVRHDVRQILLAGLEPPWGPEGIYVVIADGTFDPTRLMATGQSRGASIKRFRHMSILVAANVKEPVGVAFPQPGVLVMGNLALVEAVLQSRGSTVGIDPAFREMVNRISRANDFWFATVLPGSFLIQQVGDGLPPQLRNTGALDRISESSGGLQFGQNDRITLNLTTRSMGDAQLVSGVLHLAGSFAQLQIGENDGLALARDAFSSMQVTTEGTSVHATSVMSDAQLERALASN